MKNFDNSFLSEKITMIAGVDEAGRGPLAGPVVAAAVIFGKDDFIEGVNDSKKLTEAAREKLFGEIIRLSISYGIASVTVKTIDKINILQAALRAMRRAADKLSPKPDLILIDGNKSFACVQKTETIIKGDSKSYAIAAASILAKVTRDRIMKNAAKRFPEYGWERNKGYGTAEHIAAIKKHGPTKLHRVSFLNNILEEQTQFL